MQEVIDFFSAKDEPRVFRVFRILAALVYVAAVVTVAVWAFSSYGPGLDAAMITVAATLVEFIVVGVVWLGAEIAYEDWCGIGSSVVVIDDDEGY